MTAAGVYYIYYIGKISLTQIKMNILFFVGKIRGSRNSPCTV